VSPAAITKACKGAALKGALVRDRIDLEHPDAVAYLKRDRAPTVPVISAPDPGPAKPPHEPELADGTPDFEGEPVIETGQDIGSYADLTLRELVEKFGTERSFKDWLEALKKIEDIREKRLNNEEYQKSLISRDLVKTHVIGMIDGANRRLLHDAPKTLSRRLFALARSGAEIEEAEGTVREIISSHLRVVKDNAVKILGQTE